MQTYILSEIKRAFLSRTSLIAMFFSIILMFVGMFEAVLWAFKAETSLLYIFLQGYNGGTSNFLMIAFPILACIPFASTYRTDYDSGFSRYVYTRMEKAKYMTVKFVINCLAGGFVIVIGPLIALLFLLMLKPLLRIPMVNQELETVNTFHQAGIYSPIMMLIIILVTLFFCGVIFSALGLGVSTVIKNKYVAMLIPFAYVIISATFLRLINEKLNAIYLYDVDYTMSIFQRFAYGAVLITISILLFFIGGSKKLEEKSI
ncbi:hypothetical protein [Bacillus kwashiorkori]|uniref:hypothetical protein n=1 Tax=Bacillus kwashiorkori TaxID=1522318 RepID=UPI000785EB13|nr:hypothetical protein [Bacillus kwashiorkori]